MKDIRRLFSNLPGWFTKYKIVVIESDDWGSVRMPSHAALQRMKNAGLPLGNGEVERYNKFDTLASKKDLESLFDTLSSFKDSRGFSPIITALSLVANPDFKAIEDGGFEKYYFESIDQTLRRYGKEDAWNLWQKGVEEKVFEVEFHGREHLNVAAWMRALKKRDKHTLIAFNERFWGFTSPEVNYQAAFDLEFLKDLKIQAQVISSGLKLFKNLHGKNARFFVPPNGPFHNSLQKPAYEHGVRYLSTSKIQQEPLGEGRTRRRFHYLGQRTSCGMTHITRNCFFEPSALGRDWVDSCLSEVRAAFRVYKPAVISTHRVNYIGGLDQSNSTRGLTQLKVLLKSIQKNWPDAIYLTSSQLGDLIARKKGVDELVK